MYNRKYLNKYLEKRDNILIKNNFNILYKNNYNDIFDIVCYYISDNITKVIIRRIDKYEGWGQNLMIGIENINNNIFEEYSVGSSNNNIKIIEIYLKTPIFKTIYEDNKIPKVIIQTWDDDIYKNNSHYNNTLFLIELNPEYEYKFFDNHDCINFIKDNFDKNIFDNYNSIISNKIKSELFRYCYLYINGGCYINSNLTPKIPLHKIINQNDNIILCYDEINNLHYNGIIMVLPKNDLIYDLIYFIIEDFEKTFESKKHLELNKIFNRVSSKLIKKENKIFNNDNKLIFVKKEKFKDKKFKDKKFKDEKTLIFEKTIIINDFIFNFYPQNYKDEFNIFNIKDNIYCIQRIDINSGWAEEIKLQVTSFSKEDNMLFIKDIFIGSSDKNKKLFVI